MTDLAPTKTTSNYSLIGVINLLLGAGQFGLSLVSLIFVLPKVLAMYSDFNASVNRGQIYASYGLILFMGIINILVGLKLFKKPTDKLLKLGIISGVVTTIVTIFLISYGSAASLGPIYGLTVTQ